MKDLSELIKISEECKVYNSKGLLADQKELKEYQDRIERINKSKKLVGNKTIDIDGFDVEIKLSQYGDEDKYQLAISGYFYGYYYSRFDILKKSEFSRYFNEYKETQVREYNDDGSYILKSKYTSLKKAFLQAVYFVYGDGYVSNNDRRNKGIKAKRK